GRADVDPEGRYVPERRLDHRHDRPDHDDGDQRDRRAEPSEGRQSGKGEGTGLEPGEPGPQARAGLLGCRCWRCGHQAPLEAVCWIAPRTCAGLPVMAWPTWVLIWFSTEVQFASPG